LEELGIEGFLIDAEVKDLKKLIRMRLNGKYQKNLEAVVYDSLRLHESRSIEPTAKNLMDIKSKKLMLKDLPLLLLPLNESQADEPDDR